MMRTNHYTSSETPAENPDLPKCIACNNPTNYVFMVSAVPNPPRWTRSPRCRKHCNVSMWWGWMDYHF